jgi:hypothetical protein
MATIQLVMLNSLQIEDLDVLAINNILGIKQ